jgi:hypothetical protein
MRIWRSSLERMIVVLTNPSCVGSASSTFVSRALSAALDRLPLRPVARAVPQHRDVDSVAIEACSAHRTYSTVDRAIRTSRPRPCSLPSTARSDSATDERQGVMSAMLQMTKIDIAELEGAYVAGA